MDKIYNNILIVSRKLNISIYMVISMMIGMVLYVDSPLYAKDKEVPPPEFQYEKFVKSFQLEKSLDNEFTPLLLQEANLLNANLGVDVLTDFELDKNLIRNISDDDLDKLIYRVFLSISSQEGIEYYSYRRKRYRVFMLDSYMVNSLDERKEISDDRFDLNEDIPRLHEFYIFQKDSSFGSGVRKVSIHYNKELHQFYIKFSNEDTIKYQGFLPIVKKHEYLLCLLINREGNLIKMRSVSLSHTNTFNALKDRIIISIAYRMQSLTKWFETQFTQEISNLQLE